MTRRPWWDIELWPGNPMGRRLFWRRPAWIPRVYWRRVCFLRWLGAGCGATCLGVLLFSHRVGDRYVFLFYQALMWTWLLIFAVFPRVVFRRLTHQLLANDCLICLSCGYLLHGLPEEHVCPECGTPYRADDLRHAWQHWLVHRRLPEHAPPT
jgi:hypothetical protein